MRVVDRSAMRWHIRHHKLQMWCALTEKAAIFDTIHISDKQRLANGL